MTPRFLRLATILSIHLELLAEHGGIAGVRDQGLLESALARPETIFGYGEVDIADLVAAYAEGLARNHPFLDGNKRVAWMAAMMFLDTNGWEFDAPMPKAYEMMIGLTVKEITAQGFAVWLRAGLKKIA